MAVDSTTSQRRRAALGQDALLFCGAFTFGAVVFTLIRALWLIGGADHGSGNYWEIGLSDGLITSGLIAGELFILWNNGIRQGRRGHSIGKHRLGLRVVDIATETPAGSWRGLARGVVMAALLDLAVAAIPIGLPTVLRRLTPESWHFGGAAYVALIVLLVPFLLNSRRGLADLLTHTVVVEAPADTVTASRRQLLDVLGLAGLLGVAAVAANYVWFYWPLFFRFPALF